MPTIKDIIEKPHPIYTRYVNYWDFLLESYEGGVDYTNAEIPFDTGQKSGSDVIPIYANGKEVTSKHLRNNLFMHPKERKEHFSDRQRMSYYYNFCQPIIDIYTDHLFRQPVNEEWENLEDIVETRQENMDKRGSSIHEIRKEIADMAQIFGHCFVVVDMPPSSGEVNLEQRIVNDQFPYISVFKPQHILNWSLDSFGRPYWVILLEPGDTNIDPFNYDKDKKGFMNYRLWTRSAWYLYNHDYDVIDEGAHGLGVVPIVPVYDRPSKKYRGFHGISSLSDISFIARDIYNLCSELSQIIRDQTFAFLALQGDISDYQGDNALGTRKGLIYPRDTNAPQYIAPSADSAQTVMDQIDRQIHKIHQIAKLEGGTAHQKSQIADQSGIAKAFDFQQTDSTLNKKSSNFNDAEMKVWELIANWEGREFEGSVSYPTEFSVRDINADIDEAIKCQKLSLGKLATIETNKAILRKKFDRLPEEEIEKMVNDMETEVNKGDTVERTALTLADRIKQRQTAFSGAQPGAQ